MKRGAPFFGAFFALCSFISALPAQTNEPVTIPREDPLVVAANLAREVDGSPGNKDHLLSLEECLVRTFTNNPDIQTQKSLIEEALGEKILLHSRAFPQANIGGIAGEQGPRETGKKAQDFVILNGDFRQPLFEASIPASFRRGTIGVVVAQQNFQQQASTILHNARLHYYEALYQRGTLAIFNELQKPLDENIKNAKDLVTTGLGTKSGVSQAQIRSLQLVPQRETARQQYLESLSLLAQDMGSNLKDPAAVQLWPKGPLPYLPIHYNLAAATDEALKNRPDIQLLRSLIIQTTEDRRITQAGYYPRIDLAANVQYLPNNILANSNSSRPEENTESTQLLVGPVLTWNVIDTGVVTGTALTLEKAKEDYELKLADLEQNAPKNLAEIYRALDLSQKRIASLAKSVNLAEENLKMVQDMIPLNQASQLDFVNARNSLLQSKQGMLDAFLDNSIALANLDLATGRYLRYVDPQDRKN